MEWYSSIHTVWVSLRSSPLSCRSRIHAKQSLSVATPSFVSLMPQSHNLVLRWSRTMTDLLSRFRRPKQPVSLWISRFKSGLRRILSCLRTCSKLSCSAGISLPVHPYYVILLNMKVTLPTLFLCLSIVQEHQNLPRLL